MNTDAVANPSRYKSLILSVLRSREALSTLLLQPGMSNDVDTENYRSFLCDGPCRDHRLFSALSVASQGRLSVATIACYDQPVAVRVAAHATPGRQWPDLRSLWRCLRGYRPRLAQSGGWRQIVCVGLGRRRNRLVRNVDYCDGLARRSLVRGLFGFRKTTRNTGGLYHV
jgi:hypothetical protein